MISRQGKDDLSMFIVDYHAITVEQDPKELQSNILYAAAAYLAAGLDPKKSLVFQQSRVSAHTELAWILTTMTGMGELERMTQFKDKSAKGGAKHGVGLFTYPVLMAADILLYDTKFVPVGEDQKQHLELARTLAKRFNHRFGETFVVPEPVIRKTGARIMALDDPTGKMSKSAKSAKNYISLMDDDKTIMKKVKSAVTDSENSIRYEMNRPGVSNLMTILSLTTGMSIEAIEEKYKDATGYGDFKVDVAEALIAYFSPIREKIQKHLLKPEKLKKILDAGAKEANKKAEAKMKLVRQRIGVEL